MDEKEYTKEMERNLNLEEFGFSPRIIHVLNRNKINKDKLITMTYMELANLRTVGPDKIEEIQKALEANGYFNIQLPNIRYATKTTKAEYKNKLVEELLKLVIEHSGLKIKKNKIDSLIYKDLRKEYEGLNINSLELRIAKIKETINE